MQSLYNGSKRYHYQSWTASGKSSLGDVELNEQPSTAQLQQINNELEQVGFEVLTDQKKQLIEKIKSTVINYPQKENNQDNSLKYYHRLTEDMSLQKNLLRNWCLMKMCMVTMLSLMSTR